MLGDLGNHHPLVRLHRFVPKEKHVWMLPLFPPRAQHLEKAAQHCQAWLVNLPGVPLHVYMMENCKHGYSGAGRRNIIFASPTKSVSDLSNVWFFNPLTTTGDFLKSLTRPFSDESRSDFVWSYDAGLCKLFVHTRKV